MKVTLTVVLLFDAHIKLWHHERLAVFDQDAAHVASKLSGWLVWFFFFNWKEKKRFVRTMFLKFFVERNGLEAY